VVYVCGCGWVGGGGSSHRVWDEGQNQHLTGPGAPASYLESLHPFKVVEERPACVAATSGMSGSEPH
jgi:hypothetical protein